MGERIQMRRRLRQQRRAREAMLLDLGALVFELHRQGRRAPELLQHKAAELEVVDEEVRRLEGALAGVEAAGEPGASGVDEPDLTGLDPEEEDDVDAVEDDPAAYDDELDAEEYELGAEDDQLRAGESAPTVEVDTLEDGARREARP